MSEVDILEYLCYWEASIYRMLWIIDGQQSIVVIHKATPIICCTVLLYRVYISPVDVRGQFRADTLRLYYLVRVAYDR